MDVWISSGEDVGKEKISILLFFIWLGCCWFATSVLSESINLNFDSEGRVSIPEKLLKHAKIKSNIVFVGLGKVFQIWDPKLFESFKLTARKKSHLNRSALRWDNKFKKEGV